MTIKESGWKVLSCLGLVLPFLLVSQEVQAQADFYEGKTITIIQGRRPGGSGDMRVRAVMPFPEKYIPGNPTIVSEFMPGGGRKAANYLYNTARPDGAHHIANVGAGIVTNAVHPGWSGTSSGVASVSCPSWLIPV